MRLFITVFLAVGCVARAQSIPPIKTSLNLDGQAVAITVWGNVSAGRFAVTVDLGDFQENLTAVLAAQLNRSDRCGERLTVGKAVLAPAAPSSVITATVHYERYVCAKALGKEIVKKLVGGNGVVEASLTPAVGDGHIVLTAQVQKVDADGSLGELLRSGSLGDSIRTKIAASIESSVQKAASLKSALPAQVEGSAAIKTVQFADGGAGRLWLTVGGSL
jgi:hypothetical protein